VTVNEGGSVRLLSGDNDRLGRGRWNWFGNGSGASDRGCFGWWGRGDDLFVCAGAETSGAGDHDN
jgi:hypothetical protein